MKKTTQLTLLLITLLSLSSNKALAFAVENEGVTIYYEYSYDGTELIVTSGGHGSYSGTVVIPDEVTYENRSLKVTSIGFNAFQDCTGLTSVTIGNSVTSIGSWAFSGCTGLTSVIIPNSVTSIGQWTFDGCSSLTSVTIPNSVTSIGDFAFAGCTSLTEATIGNSVARIGDEAFSGCRSLTSVTIPNSVTSLGWYAFSFCTSLTEATIGNSLTYITDYTFIGCSSLTSITIGNSVTSIGEGAFIGCSSLTSVTIPNSVAHIGVKAFASCTGLTSITIPNSVTVIGEQAFDGCSSLTSVISEIDNPFYIDYTTFSQYTYNNATLYVPGGTIDKYKSTDSWNCFLHKTAPDAEKCAKPTIYYEQGRLTFGCETEGVQFKSSITDTDIRDYNAASINLTVTYNISVYATKSGLEDSEVAYGTLCWIDVEPQKEGIEDGTASFAKPMQAMPVLIQAENGEVSVQGVPEGTLVSVYDVNGRELGSTLSRGSNTKVSTQMSTGSVAVVKMGNRAVKVLMK